MREWNCVELLAGLADAAKNDNRARLYWADAVKRFAKATAENTEAAMAVEAVARFGYHKTASQLDRLILMRCAGVLREHLRGSLPDALKSKAIASLRMVEKATN